MAGCVMTVNKLRATVYLSILITHNATHLLANGVKFLSSEIGTDYFLKRQTRKNSRANFKKSKTPHTHKTRQYTPRISDCYLPPTDVSSLPEEVKWWGWTCSWRCWLEWFLTSRRPAFACTSTTNVPIDIRRVRADLGHRTGPEIPLHRILRIAVSCCTGGEELYKLEMFSLVAQQPAVLWQNG